MKSASAPGKVILFGEHSVVYPNPQFPDAKPHYGIAAAIDRRCKVSARRIDKGIEIFQRNKKTGEFERYYPNTIMTAVIPEIMKTYSIGGVELKIDSDVPKSSHLGSSSSVFAAVAAAVLLEHEENITPEVVSHFARMGDKAIVGTPSGIDDTTVSYGGWIKYVKESPTKGTLTRMDMQREVEVVIGSTGISSSTGEVVKKLKERVAADASLLNYIDKINEICDRGEMALRNNDMHALGGAMNANHEILKGLGVSHEKLDDICRIALSAGAYGAKMTGGGGGGCAIIVAENPDLVLSVLKENGYTESFLTKLGCDGVREEKSF